MVKKGGKKKGGRGQGATRLLPHTRQELAKVVDDVFKRCTKVPSTATPNAAQEWQEFTELYQLIQDIRRLEQDVVLPRSPRQEQVAPFMAWLKEKNVKVQGVEIQDFGGCEGFGLRVTETLKQGQEVISVPRPAMITEDTAKKSYLGGLIERDPILQRMGNVGLALHVLAEYVNPASPWRPYLHVLPDTYTTTLYYTPEELLMLKGSPAMEEAIRQYRNIARQYSYFYRIFFSLPEARSWPIRDYFTFDAYRWAVSTVMTRQNRIPGKGATEQLALIPAWDMCNHEEGIYSTDFNDEKETCLCMAQKEFAIGDQFTIYYGKRYNGELFLHNGFVQEDNSSDSLAIKLGVSKNDPLHGEKTSLLTSLGLPSSGSFLLVPGPHPISPGLLAFTRVFCMDKDALSHWTEQGDKAQGLVHEDCDVGTSTQDNTWRFLHTRVTLLTRAYPTTLKEDEEALAGLSGHAAIARRLVMSEKRILRDAANYLACRIPK